MPSDVRGYFPEPRRRRNLTRLLPAPVDFQRNSRDFRPLPCRLRADFACRIFIGAEIRLDLGFDAVQATLADLVRGGLLRRASSGAYDEWQACLARIGPWVTAPDMCRLVQVLVRDTVTHADCATWTMRWQVTGPGGPLFPALDADIKLTPAGADATTLAVYAAYRPPLGGLGTGPDQAIMHQAAEVMIQSFTIYIQIAIVHSAGRAPRQA